MATAATQAAREDAFPARFKQTEGKVGGIPTEISCMNFSDKIMITISQGGRVAQWIQVPLSAPSSSTVDMAAPGIGMMGTSGALPANHLTPKTLFGAGGDDRDTLGQLYAAQIASHLCLRDPDDRRTLMLGLGFDKVETGREAFFDVLELIQKVL